MRGGGSDLVLERWRCCAVMSRTGKSGHYSGTALRCEVKEKGAGAKRSLGSG